jgi:hypothetical protein
MSDATQPRTIPVGILVSVTDSSRSRVQRLRRPRKPMSRVALQSPVPWREMLAGVSAVWLVLIVGVALWAGASSPPLGAVEPGAAAPTLEPVSAAAMAPVVVDPDAPALIAPEPEPRPPLLDRLVAAPAALPELTEASIAPEPRPAPVVPPAPPRACVTKLGTQIDFVADPPEAFKRAGEQNKLVFMIHLSGNFEDKEFT